MSSKRSKPKAPRPSAPLPLVKEELYCQLRVDGASQADAYRTASNTRSSDAASRKQAWRWSLRDHIKARIHYLETKRDEALLKQCHDFEVDRAAVIANAVLGWRMARKKGDLTAMSRHNNDMANFAREAYWNNQTEITMEGPLERMLKEVEDEGPFKPGNGSTAGEDNNEPPGAA